MTNGCDDEPVPAPRRDGQFTVAYAGSIYLDRDPRLLFRAAARVVRELRLSPADFRIALIGNIDSYGGVPISEMAREEGIGEFVECGPARPRREAMEFLAEAAVLVSLPQDSRTQVPSKVFEYMCFDAWLLALSEEGSATELLLRDTDADVVDPQDVDGIAAVLARRYRQYTGGTLPTRISGDARFSRRYQARLLLDALEECLARRPAPQPPAGATLPGAIVAGATQVGGVLADAVHAAAWL